MKFRVTSPAFQGEMILPNDSFLLVFHDTGNRIQMWASDGLIDEFPATTIELLEEEE